MSDTSTTTTEDLLRQLRELQARVGPSAGPMPPMGGAAGAPAGPAWMQPAQASQPMPLQPLGLLVAVSIPTPNGEATCHLQFGPEAANDPQRVLQQLMQAGWPVKTWQKQNGGGGFGRSFGGGGGGGGWGGSGRRW